MMITGARVSGTARFERGRDGVILEGTKKYFLYIMLFHRTKTWTEAMREAVREAAREAARPSLFVCEKCLTRTFRIHSFRNHCWT